MLLQFEYCKHMANLIFNILVFILAQYLQGFAYIKGSVFNNACNVVVCGCSAFRRGIVAASVELLCDFPKLVMLALFKTKNYRLSL